MNLPVILVLLCFGFLNGTTAEDKKDSVKLTVFYESYCPYSIEFIVNQLYKTWNEFKDNIRLDLVPFGNAKQTYENDHFVFTCQHGPKECVGNILHACAIYQACGSRGTLKCPVDQLSKAINYIDCVMQQNDQRTASNKCARKANLQPSSINKCAKDSVGNNLESAYGNQTVAFHNPKVTYVPFIVFNNKHTEEEQEAAEKDLKSVVCKYIPDKC
ncbi:gamma-interferon-inducible lysosomal thiol reductase-like [Macrosteles quadrilineatus]|uniref:gamma-interferon-inducible lysosomal thiol reductase-like n=1 Tax=Macrosteles quadrilineatus TaxID=74068 RepID=UPI0023E28522|nr:gamma-interferon-inducible lysosomal thiol reductase-like [Macrosteles quadrilineatus]XP_054275607.1 gamma-interferon-inducible lysosomal thiol reductase-like [Macrosteles quadrilineatus]